MPDSTDSQKTGKAGVFRRARHFLARDGRDHLWDFLNLMDARPRLRRLVLVGIPCLLIAGGLGAWWYRDWSRTNALRIARQWLDAGRLDRAADAVQDALSANPGAPASWRLASELAWRKGNSAVAVEYAKRAAAVGGYRQEDVLAWGEAAVLSDDTEQAEEAEARLDPATAAGSARALRLSGEVARRQRRYPDARDRFQAALEADTRSDAVILAADEVPLGIVCLQTGSPVDVSRGRALLIRWVSNSVWGAEALRALLADAIAHGDRDSAARWAQSLRMHPRCTLGDIPFCLKALVDRDPARYQAMLTPIEEGSRLNPVSAAQLLGWLTQIGQGAEAVRWGRALAPAIQRHSSVVLGIAEALRATRQWRDLKAWVESQQLDKDVTFLGWAYLMAAARELGDTASADALWQSVRDDGLRSPTHALFLGDTLYAWGYPRESEDLITIASDRPELAYQALGSLVRLSQVRGDTVGEYKAFSRLSEIRPSDRTIANNYAYFAAVTDLGSQTRVLRIAEDNFRHDPDNLNFRSTLAFVLVWSGQAGRALELMEPVSKEWRKSRAVAFAYGAALAGVDRKEEAKQVFGSIDPAGLGKMEIDWIRAALR